MGHDTTEGIDLPYHMTLGQPPDGRIAGHLRDGVEVLGEDGGLATQPGGGHRRLHPGMAGSADNDVVVLGEGVEAGGHGGDEPSTGRKLFHVEQKGIAKSVSKGGEREERMGKVGVLEW